MPPSRFIIFDYRLIQVFAKIFGYTFYFILAFKDMNIKYKKPQWVSIVMLNVLYFTAVLVIITSGSPFLSLPVLCLCFLSLSRSLPTTLPLSSSTAYSVMLSQSTDDRALLNHCYCLCGASETVATQFSWISITCDRLLGYGLQNELERNHTLVRLGLSLKCNTWYFLFYLHWLSAIGPCIKIHPLGS